GGTELVKVDVRIIAATHRDLQRMVAEGDFRQDLYYRLSAFPVYVPTLRERKDDIARLAEHFLIQLEGSDRHVPLSSDVIEVLMSHDYPGNVRELRNVIERAAILACDDIIRPDHIVFEKQISEEANVVQDRRSARAVKLLNRRTGRLTEQDVIRALQETGGHRAQAAERLGVSERTLYRYIRKLRGTG
ncbi:MAG: sigma-54-dependent Fis family transcriptional regulator, partial [Gammaproteobacteria bacterium]